MARELNPAADALALLDETADVLTEVITGLESGRLRERLSAIGEKIDNFLTAGVFDYSEHAGVDEADEGADD